LEYKIVATVIVFGGGGGGGVLLCVINSIYVINIWLSLEPPQNFLKFEIRFAHVQLWYLTESRIVAQFHIKRPELRFPLVRPS
jgi:hypothetical protein